MATIDDLVNAQAYRRAAMAEGLAMGKTREGDGGSPYTAPPKENPGPFVPSPRKKPNNNMTIAHHTEHFVEPTIDDLIKGVINGDIPKGTLGPEEDRMIEEYKKRNTNQSMLISGAQDINTKMNPLQDGSFLDEDGNRYLWSPREQKFLDMGPYDPDVHGLPIPLANKNKMTIA